LIGVQNGPSILTPHPASCLHSPCRRSAEAKVSRLACRVQLSLPQHCKARQRPASHHHHGNRRKPSPGSYRRSTGPPPTIQRSLRSERYRSFLRFLSCLLGSCRAPGIACSDLNSSFQQVWKRGRIQARETLLRAEDNLNDYQAQGLWHHSLQGPVCWTGPGGIVNRKSSPWMARSS